jgi:hypothetical protein
MASSPQRFGLRGLTLLAIVLSLLLVATPQASACDILGPERKAVFEGVLVSLQRNSVRTAESNVEEWTATFDVKKWGAATTLKTRPKQLTVSFSRYFDPVNEPDLNDGICEDNAIKFTFRLRSKYYVEAFWFRGSETQLQTGAYFSRQPFKRVR